MDQVPVSKTPVGPLTDMTENNTHRRSFMNLSVNKKRSNVLLILLTDSSCYAKDVEIRVALSVKNRLQLYYRQTLLQPPNPAVEVDFLVRLRYSSFKPVKDSTLRLGSCVSM